MKNFSFGYNGNRIQLSLNLLFKLVNLESLSLTYAEVKFNFSDINMNCFSNKLKSIKLKDVIIDVKIFKEFIKTVPNIEKFAIIETQNICLKRFKNHHKSECYQKFLKSLLRLNNLKVLEIKLDSDYCWNAKEELKATETNIENKTFKQLKELKINLRVFFQKKKIMICNESI